MTLNKFKFGVLGLKVLTIIQIISLVIVGLINFLIGLRFNRDGSTVLPQVSYYISPYLHFFLDESEYNKIPALLSIVFVNVCLIYCTWMEKTSFDYWKLRQEKIGRCLLSWLNIAGLMANASLFLRLLFGIGTGIGAAISKRPPQFPAVCEWDTKTLNSLRNVISIHDIIGGIWILGCVQWKILYPLWKYLEITDPVYEGAKLWKLEDNKLKNGAFHILNIEGLNWWSPVWNFKTKDDLIYIENSLKNKVLEITNNGKVFLKDLEEGKAEQLWKKGEPNAEGYFTLENSKLPKVMTAVYSASRKILEIRDIDHPETPRGFGSPLEYH